MADERKLKVLLISAIYPPINHIAALRTSALKQFLDENGFDVFVLTRSTSNGKDDFSGPIFRVREKSMLKLANTNIRSSWIWHKLKSAFNKLLVNILPDENPGFFNAAVRVAPQIIADKGIDIVITSFAPLACIKLGVALKKQFPKLFWVSDVRDEISENESFSGFVRGRLDQWERRMLESADIVAAVSEPILADFRRKTRSPDRLLEIRNGFNFEPITSPAPFTLPIKIIFAGTLYGEISPTNFFKALERVLKVEQIDAPKVEVIFLGASNHPKVPISLRGIVKILPRVEYTQAINVIAGCSILLMLHPTTSRMGIYTGKLFDYLAINRPILALVDPNDVAAKLIRQCNAGWVVDNENLAGIETALVEVFEAWRHKLFPVRNWEKVNENHRNVQFGKLLFEINRRLNAKP